MDKSMVLRVRCLTTIGLRFDKLAFVSRFVERFSPNTRWYRFEKHIFRNKTKTLNFSAHKYDGYDLQKGFLGLVVPIRRLVNVVKEEKPTL